MLLRIFEKIAYVTFLILQGLYVKLTIVKLPEPEGEREGTSGDSQAPAVRVLIIGDSAAAGVGAEHQREALCGRLVSALEEHFYVHWKLFAKSGETTESQLAKLESLNTPYDYVVVSFGVNDVTKAMTQHAWLNRQAKLANLLRERSNPQKIILASLPPIEEFFALPNPLRYLMTRRARRFTEGLRAQTANDKDITILDMPALIGHELAMASDGFHPGPQIYLAWGKTAAEIIKSDVAERRS